MADALISAPVAIATGVISISMIALATKKARDDSQNSSAALMGVMGAFVFVAQMINFTIPGTGSSGHIIGGILLAAMIGRWRGFLTLCSVLIVQCLIFADGGLLALGCNILNMGIMSCLVAYPLIYLPIVRKGMNIGRIMTASILACVVGLELGAILVTVETTLSGVTMLPFGEFLMFMLPIHLAIGICEGVATGLVLTYVWRQDPSLLTAVDATSRGKRADLRRVLIVFAAVAVVLGISFYWLASTHPDGLEWSIMRITGATELAPAVAPSTAILPDYESHFAGIVGGVIVMSMLWAISAVLFRHRKAPIRR